MVKHTGARKQKKGLDFSKVSLKTPINLLIANCYFNVGDLAIKRAIGIKKNTCPQ